MLSQENANDWLGEIYNAFMDRYFMSYVNIFEIYNDFKNSHNSNNKALKYADKIILYNYLHFSWWNEKTKKKYFYNFYCKKITAWECLMISTIAKRAWRRSVICSNIK